jgi:ParB family chromosome partitioning protein
MHDEWYTPPPWIERARIAMGTIDLDPASCAFAQECVRASMWFDKVADGLRQPWAGNLWINPPYSRGTIGRFVEKLIIELDDIEQAIVLTDNRLDTEWAHDLLYASDVVAFTKGRIRFYNADGIAVSSALNGSALFYVGNRTDAFMRVFSPVCSVLEPRHR